MRSFLKKIWFPLVAVSAIAAQMWAVEGARGSFAATEAADTVIYDNSRIFTKFRKDGSQALRDSLEGTIYENADTILAKDTIKAPDSLRLTDPFRYKWYVALVDSLAHRLTIDSLREAKDTLTWKKIDSIYFADSTAAAKRKFELWYNSLSKEDRKRYDYEQKLKRQQKILDSLMTVRDSIKHIKDSIAENTPRILETFALADSMHYKRVISWTRDPYFSKMKEVSIPDTTFNYWFHDYKFMRDDVGATYLGTIGSPMLLHDYFKRKSVDNVSFYEPYEIYSYSPSTLPMYNTKTPYTELSYWGNLFSNAENEESIIHLLVSQNIYPALNLTLGYDRHGSNGNLNSEKVDNRTFFASFNYLGQKYLAHGGFITNTVNKNENAGMTDSFWIRDTTVGPREIPVRMEKATNKVTKKTLFLDQQYRVPLPFLNKLFGHEPKDSTDEVTTAFIGHSSELSEFKKIYTDELTTDSAREVYKNIFYINPKKSYDSLRVLKLENKFFVKLQPWSPDAILSTIDVGLGNRILNYYMFKPDSYIHRQTHTTWNSTYLYGGAGGHWKGFDWNAQAYVTMVGPEAGDTGIKAEADYAFFPFRRARKSPVKIHLGFETTLDEPEYYQQHYFGNHDKWDNDFGKISRTTIEGSIDIPRWKFKAGAAYAFLKNNMYYDSLGVIHQNAAPMSVAKFYLQKDFSLWKLHMDNRLLLQVSSKKDVLPLPTFAANSRVYFQFTIVKDIMTMQLGADATYNTAWYAHSYRPSTGMFTNQDKEKFGNCPYIDLFVNVQWKRACIFVKMVNAGRGWPSDRPDFFSAAGYIRPEKILKFGIWIPFYTSHIKNPPLSERASD